VSFERSLALALLCLAPYQVQNGLLYLIVVPD
jgi:hypothetical protein